MLQFCKSSEVFLILSRVYLLFFVLIVQSCIGTKKSEEVEGEAPSDASDHAYLVYSLSENPFSLRDLNQGQAKKIAKDFENKSSDDAHEEYKALEGAMVGERLSGASLDRVLGFAKKVSESGYRIGLKEPVSQAMQLEVALAAIINRNYDMADFYLSPLAQSKDPKIKAAALNAQGVIALREGQIPEAVQFWQSALRVDPKMEGANLNLGYLALGHAAFETAQSALLKLKEDHLASSGVATAKRLANQNDAATEDCQGLVKELSGHAPTLFNCGLMYMQNLGNRKVGQSLISKAMKQKSVPQNWLELGRSALKMEP